MPKIKTFLAALALSALLTSPAGFAQLYKWVDDQGKVHYGDSPPEGAALKQIRGNVTSFSSATVEPFELDETLLATRAGSKSVVMYSTSWCGYCKQAARHFRKHRIPFREYDIEKSAKGLRDYKKLNGRGVPIIIVGKQRMNGFDARAFDRMYFGKS